MLINDIEILTLILKKEADFSHEIRLLSDLLKAKSLKDEISDYLSGLNDLKSDFLLSAQEKISQETETEETLFSNKYWYFQRT